MRTDTTLSNAQCAAFEHGEQILHHLVRFSASIVSGYCETFDVLVNRHLQPVRKTQPVGLDGVAERRNHRASRRRLVCTYVSEAIEREIPSVAKRDQHLRAHGCRPATPVVAKTS